MIVAVSIRDCLPYVYVAVALLILIVTVSVFVIAACIRGLARVKLQTSPKTYKMHRSLMKALIVQVRIAVGATCLMP